jgi:hypothetical protein
MEREGGERAGIAGDRDRGREIERERDIKAELQGRFCPFGVYELNLLHSVNLPFSCVPKDKKCFPERGGGCN